MKQQVVESQKNFGVVQRINAELRNENDILRQQSANLTSGIRDQIVRSVEDQDLVQEIQKVSDPSSFSALNSILTRMNKLKIEVQNLRSQLSEQTRSTRNLERANYQLKKKSQKAVGESTTFRSKVSQLQSQNDFLLNQVEFSHKQLKKQADKKTRNLQNSAGSEQEESPLSQGNDSQILDEVCTILRVEDRDSLIASVKTIESAYQYLPFLQETVEKIFKVVIEGNIFETPINSYDVNYPYFECYEGCLLQIGFDRVNRKLVNELGRL